MPPPVAAFRRERRPSYVESPFARRMNPSSAGSTSQVFAHTQLSTTASSVAYSEPPPPVVMSAAPPPVQAAAERSPQTRGRGRRVPAFVSSLALMAVGAGLAVACFAAFERRFAPEAPTAGAAATVPVAQAPVLPVSVPVVAPAAVMPAAATTGIAPSTGAPLAIAVAAPEAAPHPGLAPKRGQVINFGAADGLKVDATPAPAPVVRRTVIRKVDKPKLESPSDVLASALGTAAAPESPPPPPPVAETPLAVQLAPEAPAAPLAPAKPKSAADTLAEAQLRAPMK
jgi:DNA polymerase-3 subunit gamma/tau